MTDALPPFWNPETDDTLVCVATRRETHDVMTFVFEGREPRRFAYQPGQFMTFEVEVGEETLNRCYTLSSSPTRPDRISITVKAISGGAVSNWMHTHIKPGHALKALGPMGDFHCKTKASGKYLFLSAGSGVTPLLSMTRAAFDLASPADIAFVHAARSPADLIARDELALMARANPHLTVTSICEGDSEYEAWNGYRGRIDLGRLTQIAPDFLEREVYVCGPAPYMAGARNLLEAAGYDMARYHAESFDFGELGAVDTAPDAPASLDVRTYQVEFTKTRRTIEVAADSFVLDAAKAAGMRLPSSCAKGMCGTCKCKLVSGTVDMTPAGGIRQREIDQGLILICCARPTSDLVVER